MPNSLVEVQVIIHPHPVTALYLRGVLSILHQFPQVSPCSNVRHTYTSMTQYSDSKLVISVVDCGLIITHTCLLVALAMSIKLTSNCNQFTLADRAFSKEHNAETALTCSPVTSSFTWFMHN